MYYFRRGSIRSSSLVALVSATVLLCGIVVAPMPRSVALALPNVDCSDAQWAVGINIPDKRDIPSGDIARIDAIRRRSATASVGYRYTLNDGRTYVADRGRRALTLESLEIMNDVVNAMSTFRYNAFDPRDGGAVVYLVKWDAGIAMRLGLETVPCPAKQRTQP